MLNQCWANVVDDGPTLVQHWVDVLCLLGEQFGANVRQYVGVAVLGIDAYTTATLFFSGTNSSLALPDYAWI